MATEWAVSLTRKAAEQIDSPNERDRKLALDIIRDLQEGVEPSRAGDNLDEMDGYANRLRSVFGNNGEYRFVYEKSRTKKSFLVVGATFRGEIYKGMKRLRKKRGPSKTEEQF